MQPRARRCHRIDCRRRRDLGDDASARRHLDALPARDPRQKLGQTLTKMGDVDLGHGILQCVHLAAGLVKSSRIDTSAAPFGAVGRCATQSYSQPARLKRQYT
jgi:hypothetical protein